jgi:hypothetical protein
MFVTVSGMRVSRGTPIDGTAPIRLMSSANRSSSVIFASVSRARASTAASSAGLKGVATEGWGAEADVVPDVEESDDLAQPVPHARLPVWANAVAVSITAATMHFI